MFWHPNPNEIQIQFSSFVYFAVLLSLMISLSILNPLYETLCTKSWKDSQDVDTSVQHIKSQVQRYGSYKETPPILRLNNRYIIHSMQKDLIFMALLEKETPPLLIIDFLSAVGEIFTTYFGHLDEVRIMKHKLTVYRLLDQMADNGFPSCTEEATLSDLVPPPLSVLQSLTHSKSTDNQTATSLASNIRWRKSGIRHTANRILFDIVEYIDTIIDPYLSLKPHRFFSNGTIVSSDIHGEIKARCELSGMPDLTLSFKNSELLSDCAFHPCVRYKVFDRDRVLSFVPPDGAFQLMKFRIIPEHQFSLPIYVKPQFVWNDNGSGSFSIGISSKIGSKKTISEAIITIPFPKSVTNCKVKAPRGTKATFSTKTRVLTWKLGKLPASQLLQLSGVVSLLGTTAPTDANPSVSLSFKIMKYSISGLQVETLSMSREQYSYFKGVRSITVSGKYQIRS